MARTRSSARTTLVAGLVAGTLDILDAILFSGVRSHISAQRVLQSIASGVFGRSAYSGHWPLAMMGLLLHYCIATFWAAAFVFLARYVPVMRQHAVSAGLVFGLFIYGVMNIIVLPYTRTVPHPSHAPLVVFNGVCAAVFLVGLPIALVNRKLG